jgi:hypothetical protein
MNILVSRMIRAAKLEVGLYEEVEADQGALGQAMAVVVLSALAAGIGQIGETKLLGLVVGAVWALVGWYVWAYLTYFIGTRFLPEPQTECTQGQLLRTIGFSSSPGVLRVFGFIPVLGGLISLIALIWMLVAMIIAVRQALDYKSMARAVGVCLIGWVVLLVITGVLGLIFGGFGFRA